ncbi:MAG: hypothetical protein RLZZ490_1807 [Cyanobacteriota bacterium]
MGLLEAHVHHLLKTWQQQQGVTPWPHALTMGRLVSRALRLRRSALIQTGCLPSLYGVSYLLPCLLSDQPIRLVTTTHRREKIVCDILPALKTWLSTTAATKDDSLGWLEILTPQQWLQDGALESPDLKPVLTVIEQGEYLEDWTRQIFSHHLDWSGLQSLFTQDPQRRDDALTHWSRLSQSLFSRPPNPHGCYLLDTDDIQALRAAILQYETGVKMGLHDQGGDRPESHNPTPPQQVSQFWQFWQAHPDNHLLWAEVDRRQGRINLHLSPIDVKPWLSPIWRGKPPSRPSSSPSANPEPSAAFLVMGSSLDVDKTAPTFRKTLGLPDDLLCLKFIPHRAQDALPIYSPDRLPLPNTPAFQPTLLAEITALLHQVLTLAPQSFVVILLDDLPLKAQLGSQLAAEFGSAVKVEPPVGAKIPRILVGGWRYWRDHQECFPAPQILILGTLPIPSLEHPLVASRVQYHKRHHQDWFRNYLLPSALKDLQQAIFPLREVGGVLVILDNRVNSRSYGREVFRALAPYAKSAYFDRDGWRSP